MSRAQVLRREDEPVDCGICGEPIEIGDDYVYDVEMDACHADHYEPDELDR